MAKNRILTTLLISTALTCAAAPVYALPENGVVSGGAAVITGGAGVTDVHQGSDRAVVDWRSFDVGTDEAVRFHQPSASSRILNRVTGGLGASQIMGRVDANGVVIIANPDGMVFGPASSVNVGSLVATSADINPASFMTGSDAFDTPPNNLQARIVNNGTITVQDSGLAALVAPQVANHGTIMARQGTVHLASGTTATIDLAGDGLIKVAVNEDTLPGASAINTGAIHAPGGTIALSAAAARNTVDALVANTGALRATSLNNTNGKIILGAEKGNVRVSGHVAADGGNIQITGRDIRLQDAQIDASSDAHGGMVRIGGDYQGQGTMEKSDFTLVDDTSSIHADGGTQDGVDNGGTIIIWSDGKTSFLGNASAKAGHVGGNGGFIEVSGKQQLIYAGLADVSAPYGAAGTLLLDPTDVEISNAASALMTGASPYEPTIADGPSVLNITDLVTALGLGNVTVRTLAAGGQAGNITVVDPLAWNTNFQLTLDAHNNIVVNAPVTARNRLIFIAGNDVDINANLIEDAGGANLEIRTRSAATPMGIANGAAGTLLLDNTDLGFIQNGWNGYFFGDTGRTGLMDVRARSWNAPVSFLSGNGEIRVNGNQTMGNRNLTITTNLLTLNANLSGGSQTLTIQPTGNVVMTLGMAAAGLSLETAELNRILTNWTNVILGSTTSTAAVNIHSRTWNNPNVTFRSRTGQMTVHGDLTFATNATFETRSNIAVNANINGTGTLNFQPEGTGTITNVATVIGTGLEISPTELGRLGAGWNTLRFGDAATNAAVNVAAHNWNNNVEFWTDGGVININGAQNFNGRNATFIADADVAINAPLTSAGGNLTFRMNNNTGSAMNVATAGGTMNLSVADLNQIQAGWNNIQIGSSAITYTGTMTLGAYNWQAPLSLYTDTGTINVSGAQNFGSHNFTVTSRGIVNFTQPVTGTGTLRIVPEAANQTLNIGAGGSELRLPNATIGNISPGWSNLIFGRTDQTDPINFNQPFTWTSPVTVLSGTGNVNIAQAQNFGTNNFTIQTDTLNVGANVTGTGILRIRPTANNRIIRLNNGTTDLAIETAEITRLNNGWSLIEIGRTNTTADIRVGASTWTRPAAFISGTNVQLLGNVTGTGGTGTNLSFAAGTNFVNGGAFTINPGPGRYLIYSADIAGSTYGPLTWDFRRYACTYGGSCPPLQTTGNGNLYAIAGPEATLTPNDPGIVEGSVVPSLFPYTLSGYLPGEQALDVITGVPLFTTSYTPSLAGGASYTIGAGLGTLMSKYGYTFLFAPGSGFVIPGPTPPATINVELPPTYRAVSADPAVGSSAGGAGSVSFDGGSVSGGGGTARSDIVTDLQPGGGESVFADTSGHASLTVDPALTDYYNTGFVAGDGTEAE